MHNANAAATATAEATAAAKAALQAERAARAAKAAPKAATTTTTKRAATKAAKAGKAPAVALTKGQAARKAGKPGACKWEYYTQPVQHEGAHTARTVYAPGRDADGVWRAHVVIRSRELCVTAGNGPKPAAVWVTCGPKVKGRQPYVAPAKPAKPKAAKAPKA